MMNATNYFGKVRQGVLGVADSEKRTPYIAVGITLTHEAANGQWINITVDRTVYWHLSDKAWPHTIKRLKAIGFTGDFDAIAFVGEAVDKGVQWVCRHEDYEGKTQERWDLANWGGEKEHTPPATDQVRKFNARWKSDQSAARVPTGAPPGPPQSTQPSSNAAPFDDAVDPDDIPF